MRQGRVVTETFVYSQYCILISASKYNHITIAQNKNTTYWPYKITCCQDTLIRIEFIFIYPCQPLLCLFSVVQMMFNLLGYSLHCQLSAAKSKMNLTHLNACVLSSEICLCNPSFHLMFKPLFQSHYTWTLLTHNHLSCVGTGKGVRWFFWYTI